MIFGLFSVRWLVRIAIIVNLVLVISTLASYFYTINSLVFWTGNKDEAGNVGGVLDYRWFGVSTVFHVRNQSLDAVYSFSDVTSYLLVTIIAFNLSALLFSLYRGHMRPYWVKIRNLTIPSAVIALLALITFLGTMTEIENALKNSIYNPLIGGGVVQSGLPSFIFVYNVLEGAAVNKPETVVLDFTPLLLLLLLVLPTVLVFLTLEGKRSNTAGEETK